MNDNNITFECVHQKHKQNYHIRKVIDITSHGDLHTLQKWLSCTQSLESYLPLLVIIYIFLSSCFVSNTEFESLVIYTKFRGQSYHSLLALFLSILTWRRASDGTIKCHPR